MMIKKLYLLIFPVSTALLLYACGNRTGNTAQIDGIIIDSIAADTVLYLDTHPHAPRCELSLHLQYVKGNNAKEINSSILHAGLLSPDYLSLGNEETDMRQAVDSFIRRYATDYKNDYGILYQQDKENAASYNYIYKVTTQTQSEKDNVLTYIAHITTYAGGAHGINQTLARNFNVKEGRLLELTDIFKHGYEDTIKELIIQKTAKKFGVKGIEQLQEQSIFTDGDIYIPDNFILSNKRITFIYCEDEIAPHAVGEIRVDIEWSEIKELLS